MLVVRLSVLFCAVFLLAALASGCGGGHRTLFDPCGCEFNHEATVSAVRDARSRCEIDGGTPLMCNQRADALLTQADSSLQSCRNGCPACNNDPRCGQ